MFRTMVLVAGILLNKLLSTTEGFGQLCRDLEPLACSEMAKLNSKMCMETTLATAICPNHCHRCPLKCYNCNTTTRTVRGCNTIFCNSEEVCMVIELPASEPTYVLRCANASVKSECCHKACNIRRSNNVRSENITCCSYDLCNTPGMIPLMTSSQKLSPTSATATISTTTSSFVDQIAASQTNSSPGSMYFTTKTNTAAPQPSMTSFPTSQSSTAGRCWMFQFYSAVLDTYYKYIPHITKKWEDASPACVGEGGVLTTLKDEVAFNAVQSMLATTMNDDLNSYVFWVNAHYNRSGNSSNFLWGDDLSAISIGSPPWINSQEPAMKTGRANDTECVVMIPFYGYKLDDYYCIINPGGHKAYPLCQCQ